MTQLPKPFRQLAFQAAIAAVLLTVAQPLAANPAVANPAPVIPFEIVAIHADYHIIAWFKGHPDYECVEAFVSGSDRIRAGSARIRAILTRHDQSQIDVFNYEGADAAPERDSYAGHIEFSLEADKRDANLTMEMPDGKTLVLSYVAQTAPDPAYGGLTDPATHSPDGGLPAMYRKASSVSGPKSRVVIDGKSYPVPVDQKISKPPFFTGYSAFLSEGYESVFFRTFAERPAKTIRANHVAFAADGAASGIESICLSPERVELRFVPPLPDLIELPDHGTATSRFELSFSGERETSLYGTVTAVREGDEITVRMLPEFPLWAKASRAMRYAIRVSGGEVTVRASMDDDRGL